MAGAVLTSLLLPGVRWTTAGRPRVDGDAAAVRSAPTEPWSSEQAEGQINRLKLIKRQSYGQAGLDLPKRRLVLRLERRLVDAGYIDADGLVASARDHGVTLVGPPPADNQW